MEEALELLKQINIAQIFVILAGFWVFYNRLDNKIERNKNEIKYELGQRMDKLSEKVEDVDRRLCRIEGSLATHGHCLFNQAAPEKKAE